VVRTAAGRTSRARWPLASVIVEPWRARRAARVLARPAHVGGRAAPRRRGRTGLPGSGAPGYSRHHPLPAWRCAVRRAVHRRRCSCWPRVPLLAQSWNAPAAWRWCDGPPTKGSPRSRLVAPELPHSAHGFVFFLAQVAKVSEPPRLVKADEAAREVYWQAPDRSKQVILGWRDGAFLPTTKSTTPRSSSASSPTK